MKSIRFIIIRFNKGIRDNGFSYIFNYDSLGNNTTVKVGTQNLITNEYEPRTSQLLLSTYGNGQQVSNDYDSLDRVIAKKYSGDARYTFEYDASGNLGYQQDLVNGVNYRYVIVVAAGTAVVTVGAAVVPRAGPAVAKVTQAASGVVGRVGTVRAPSNQLIKVIQKGDGTLMPEIPNEYDANCARHQYNYPDVPN